jgi:hypothetical protein
MKGEGSASCPLRHYRHLYALPIGGYFSHPCLNHDPSCKLSLTDPSPLSPPLPSPNLDVLCRSVGQRCLPWSSLLLTTRTALSLTSEARALGLSLAHGRSTRESCSCSFHLCPCVFSTPSLLIYHPSLPHSSSSPSPHLMFAAFISSPLHLPRQPPLPFFPSPPLSTWPVRPRTLQSDIAAAPSLQHSLAT